MPMIQQYKIVTSSTIEGLEPRVNEMLEYGWKLHGGIVCFQEREVYSYAQALYKDNVEMPGAWG